MNKKVIIFDFDGVIVDSIQLSFEINVELMPDLEYSEWQKWFEGNLYKEIRKEHSNDKSQDFFYERYNNQVVMIAPIKGMPELINELSKKYILSIVSSGTQKAINAYLNKFNLIDNFQDILGKETHYNKVDKFRIILKKYEIEAHETLIVTDTLGDIKEANEAGIKSIGVTWGVHKKSKLMEAKPNLVVMKPKDLISAIENTI